MIRVQKGSLEARCRQRGYTLHEVMPCVVSQDGDIWIVDETHPSYPRPKGLGDMVAAGLKTVGITEERVSKALGRPCGCPGRRQAMNEWGAKVLGIGKTE